MNRRKFLKALAALGMGATVPIKTLNAIDKYLNIPDIKITNLGANLTTDLDGQVYRVVRIHLSKQINEFLLEAYVEIDQDLLNLAPNPKAYIREEILMTIESMRRTALNSFPE